MRRCGSRAVLAALERARPAEYEAAGWQGWPGNPDRHPERWDQARARVAVLEAELVAVLAAEPAVP